MSETVEAIRVLGFWSWVYHRFFYRMVSRLAHRFDWHYAPEHGPFEDGKYQRWCEWCGMRWSYSKDNQMRLGSTSTEK